MSRKNVIDFSAPVVHAEEQHPSTVPNGMSIEEYVKVLQPGVKVKVCWWDRKGELIPDFGGRWTLTVKQAYKGAHCWMVSFEDGFGAVNPDRVILA